MAIFIAGTLCFLSPRSSSNIEIIVPPLDDEMKGVINEKDLCPGTPGVLESDLTTACRFQLDDDNDGVTNVLISGCEPCGC